jgi:hypothetical protein
MSSAEDKRLTQWSEGRLKQVYELARAGYPEARMAEIMLVKLVTFVSWKKSKPEFLEALEKGRYEANLETVDSLYKSANGYYYAEDIVTYDKIKHEFVHGTKQVYVPRNPWAAARILSLKMREEGWSETQRIEISQNITNTINISGVATEILQLAEQKMKEMSQDIEYTEVKNDEDGYPND